MPLSLTYLFCVAAGGALGSVLRACVGQWVSSGSPWATLFVNGMGSLVLGFSLAWVGTSAFGQKPLYGFIAIGFCGGLTTFSTFSYETLSLINAERYRVALLNVGASLAFSLFALWVGIKLSKLVA